MSSKMIDITGQTFFNWTVISKSDKTSGSGDVLWNCVCACGTVAIKPGSKVRAGQGKSCGCLRSADAILSGRKKSYGVVSSEYRSWYHMKGRCLCANDNSYKRYGGRGIKICDRWLYSFDNFFADMGKKPSPELTLERRENNGDYEPSNCYWGTSKQQARNRRTSHNGRV